MMDMEKVDSDTMSTIYEPPPFTATKYKDYTITGLSQPDPMSGEATSAIKKDQQY